MRRIAIWLMLVALSLPIWAQESAPRNIYYVDINKALQNSQIGMRFFEWAQAQNAALQAENEELNALLLEEESELAQIRTEMPPAEFLPLAEAFDQKSEALRAEFAAKNAEIVRAFETGRNQLVNNVTFQTLVNMREEIRAAAIFPYQENSLPVFDPSLDITNELIIKLDEAYARNQAQLDALIFGDNLQIDTNIDVPEIDFQPSEGNEAPQEENQ